MVITVLAIGDIIGRPGREAISRLLPQLRREYSIDLVVANGENAAGGFGLTPKIADDLFSLGIDVLTSGNHIWDQREMMTGFEDHRPILRPHNYPSGAPGRGWFCYDLGEKGPVLIGNVQGQLFMPPIDSAFGAADQILSQGEATRVRLVDIHAEATSEKIALGWYLDGRASFVFGTHTHVPTADQKILSRRDRLRQRSGHGRTPRLGDRDGQGGQPGPLPHRRAAPVQGGGGAGPIQFGSGPGRPWLGKGHLGRAG